MRVSGRARPAAASPGKHGHTASTAPGSSSAAIKKKTAIAKSHKKNEGGGSSKDLASGAAGSQTAKRRSSSAGGGGTKSSTAGSGAHTHGSSTSHTSKSTSMPASSSGKASAKDSKTSHKKVLPSTKVTKPGKAKPPSSYKSKKSVVSPGTVAKHKPHPPSVATAHGKTPKKSSPKVTQPAEEKPSKSTGDEASVKQSSSKSTVKTTSASKKVISTPLTRQKKLDGCKLTRSRPLQNLRHPQVSAKGRPPKITKVKKLSPENSEKSSPKGSASAKASSKKEESSTSISHKGALKKEEIIAKLESCNEPVMVGTKKRGPQARAEVVLKVPEACVNKDAGGSGRLKTVLDDQKHAYLKETGECKAKDKTVDVSKKGPRRRSSVGATVSKECDVKATVNADSKTPLHGGKSPVHEVKIPVIGGKSPAYGGKSPVYSGKSPSYGGKSPAHGSRSPVYVTKSPAYGGKSPSYGSKSPAYGGKSPLIGGKSPSHGGKSPSHGGKSPFHGGKSPSHGGKSPSQGGKSPSHGGKSPSQGGKSPSHGGKSPPYGSKSPHYGGKSPQYGNKSPQYGGKSPSYGGKSPQYETKSISHMLICGNESPSTNNFPKEVDKSSPTSPFSGKCQLLSTYQQVSSPKQRNASISVGSPPSSPYHTIASPPRDSSPEGFDSLKIKSSKGSTKASKDLKSGCAVNSGSIKVKKESKGKKVSEKHLVPDIKEELESSAEEKEVTSTTAKVLNCDKQESTNKAVSKASMTGRKSKTKIQTKEEEKKKDSDKEKRTLESEDKSKTAKMAKKAKYPNIKKSDISKVSKVKKLPNKTAKSYRSKSPSSSTRKDNSEKDDSDEKSVELRKKSVHVNKFLSDVSDDKKDSTDDDRRESSNSMHHCDSDASDEMTLDVLLRRSTFSMKQKMKEAAKLTARAEEAAKTESEKTAKGRFAKTSSQKSEDEEKKLDVFEFRAKKSPRYDRSISPTIKDSPKDYNPVSPLIEFPISSVESEPPKSPAGKIKRRSSACTESKPEDPSLATSYTGRSPLHETYHRPTVTFADSDGPERSRSPFSNESNDETLSQWRKKTKKASALDAPFYRKRQLSGNKSRGKSSIDSQEDDKVSDKEKRSFKTSKFKLGSPAADRFEPKSPISPGFEIKEIKGGSDVGSPEDVSCVDEPSPKIEHAPESNDRTNEALSGSDDEEECRGRSSTRSDRNDRNASSESRKDQGVKIEEIEEEDENSSSESASEEDEERVGDFPPFISLPAPTHRRRRGRGGGPNSGVAATSRAAAAAALRMKKMFGFWNGPKRHRVASLNALAKVHCLFENESHRAISAGGSSPNSDFGSGGGGGGSNITTTTTSVATTTVSTSVCTRILRSGPGLRGVGRHWDDDASSSDSSGSDSALIVPYKRRKAPRGRAKKVVPPKKQDERAESSTAPGSQSSSDSEGEQAGEEGNKAEEGTSKDSKSDDKVERTREDDASAAGSSGSTGRQRQRTGSNMMMDLKDMVVRKRMASLNASAILAASYSFEKRSRKERGSTCTTSSSVQVRLLKLEKVRKQGGASGEKPPAKRPVGRPRTVVKYEDISDPYDDEDDDEDDIRPSRTESEQKVITSTTSSAGQRRPSSPSNRDAPRKPRGRKKGSTNKPGAPIKKRRRGRPSKHEEEEEEDPEEDEEDEDRVAEGVLDRGGVIQLRAPKKVAVIVKDTDVTITGVYVNTRSTQGYCISGMQYRISSTSHTQTEATSTSVEAGGPGTMLHHPHSAEHLMTPATAYCGDPTRGGIVADPLLHGPHHGPQQMPPHSVGHQPCKSYTPLGALSSMQPPVVGVTGAGHHVIGPHHPPPPHHHHHYLHHHHHHQPPPPPPPPPPLLHQPHQHISSSKHHHHHHHHHHLPTQPPQQPPPPLAHVGHHSPLGREHRGSSAFSAPPTYGPPHDTAVAYMPGYYQPAGPLIHSGSELCRSTKAPPLPTALVLGGAVESQSLESPRPVAGPPTVPPAPAGASSIATGPPPPRSPSADDDASCSEVGLSPLPPTPSSAPLRPPPHSSASSASSASSSSSHVTSPFHRYSTQQQPPPSHHSPHLYPPPYHHPHHAHHQYYAHHHHHPSAGHAALVTHQYAPAHQELCYSPAYSPSPTSAPPSTSSPAAVAAAAAAAFASAQQYLPSGGHKYAPPSYRRYTAPPTAAPPTSYYPEVYPSAAAAAAAAAVAAGALPLPGPSSFVADSGAGTYPQAPPPPQEAYPYYAAYNPGPPTCYSHTPPDATYQPCPCPMQSCPKNVHTGPLTGESKGPGPASAEGSSNGGSNGLSFSPPPVPVSATPSAAPTGNSSTVPPQQLQHSPPPPVALLLLEPHAGNTAGKLLGHPPSPARGSAGGMPPLASCAGPPTPSSTDAAAAAADVAAAAAAASSVSSAGSAVAAAVSAIADENFDGTTNPDPVIEHSVPSVVRINEDLSSDVREQPVVEENEVSTATEVLQQQQQQPSSCEEVMGTAGEQQPCLLESKKHYEAWAVSDIHKMEVAECVKGQFDEYVEKEDVLSLMKTGKEVMKESSLNDTGKTLMNIGSYQKNYCNSLLYPDSISLKQGAKIMDSCDIRMEVCENEVKGEVKSEDETFKEEKVTDIVADQTIHFHQKASLTNFSSPRKRVSSHDIIENSVPSKKIKEDLMNSSPENLIMPVDVKLVPSKKVLAVSEKRPVDSCPSLVPAKKMKNGFKYQHVGECDLNANDHCILEGNLKTAEPSTVSDCSTKLQQTQCASLHLDKLPQPSTHVPKIVPVECQVEEGSTPEDLQHSCTVNSARIVNGAKDHAVQDVLTIPQEMLPPPTSQTCKAKKPPARRRRSHSSETKKICKTSRCDASWSCDESSSTNLPQLSNRANGVLDKSRCISQSHMVRRNSAVGSQPRGSRKGARKVSMLRSLREWPPLTSPVDPVDTEPVGAIELQTESDSQEVSESSCLAALPEPCAPVVTESEPVSSACMPPPLPVTVCKKSKKSGVLPHAKINKGMNKHSKPADQLLGSPVVDSAEVLAQQLNKFPKKVLMPKWSNGWTWEGQPYFSKIFQTSDNPPVMRKCFPSMRHEEGDLICARDCVLLKSGTRKVDLPYVAKVAALWENAEDGEMMVSLLWYYRPEHTEQGRKKEDMEDEIFASKHKDSNSVACIEDKCYVLTFNEYCRYRKEVRRIEEALPLPPLVVPEASPSQGPNEANGGSSFLQHLEHRRSHHPPSHVSPEMVFFCRRVYDFRQKRILKNPG